MRALFIHQNMPGQFTHMVKYLAANPDNEVVFITKPKKLDMKNVRKVEYKVLPQKPPGTHRFIQGLQNGICHGQPVARAGNQLRRVGFRPDVVVAHPGWGEAIYLKDVFPDVPVLNYFEFYYHAFGADTHFDPEDKPTWDNIFRIRTKNSINLLSLDSADWGLSPTYWQWRQQPEMFRDKISVIHEGVDTNVVKPEPRARVQIKDGLSFGFGDEVMTYVARDMEPYRGFPTVMRAIEILCRERPNCHFLLVGGDQVSYGQKLQEGETHKQMMLNEVDIDPDRVHFTGKLPYDKYLKILQISGAHVYLTKPFVLSWSMVESLAAGCLLVGSNTPPVVEVIEDGWNGLLADFFSPEEVAERVSEALDNPQAMMQIRENARRTVLEHYALDKCLPRQIRLLEQLANRQRPTPARWEDVKPASQRQAIAV